MGVRIAFEKLRGKGVGRGKTLSIQSEGRLNNSSNSIVGLHPANKMPLDRGPNMLGKEKGGRGRKLEREEGPGTCERNPPRFEKDMRVPPKQGT